MNIPIKEWQVDARGDDLLLGVSIGTALIDIKTNLTLLSACLNMLESAAVPGIAHSIGSFGSFEVTLNRADTNAISLFIDGPMFAKRRTQSVAIFIDKASFVEMCRRVIAGRPMHGAS